MDGGAWKAVVHGVAEGRTLSCIGEGNGNPLQHSCLENPMDRGAWRPTVHGVASVGHDLMTEAPPPQGKIKIM